MCVFVSVHMCVCVFACVSDERNPVYLQLITGLYNRFKNTDCQKVILFSDIFRLLQALTDVCGSVGGNWRT